MLLPTMNEDEVVKEVYRDLKVIKESSTLVRLKTDYDHERKKLKIKREDDYMRFYEIKTKSKNKWIILLSKSIFEEKYTPHGFIHDQCLLYNYNGHGICIYESYFGTLYAYTFHFFERYRERMGLNIPLILDVVKAYYRNNHFPMQFHFPQDEKIKYIGILRDGIIKGDYHENEKLYVHKTYISYKTANLLSHNTKKELLASLKEIMVLMEREKMEPEKKGLVVLYKFMAEFESGILLENNSIRV